ERHRAAEVEDASAVSCGVAGHLAVVQGDGGTWEHRAKAVGHTTSVAASGVVVDLAVIQSEDGVSCSRGTLAVDDSATRCERAAARCRVAVDLGLVEGHGAVIDDPRAADVAGCVVVNLAVVEDRFATVGDSAPGYRWSFSRRDRRGVTVHFA